jgi:glycosyltransferase involved in cell wall biosynthesis
MTKSLWILNHYAITPDLPGGTRHYDLAKELSSRDYQVTIFASAFHHKLRKKVRLLNGEPWAVEEVEGVRFVWLPSFAYCGNTWRRIVNMLDYAWRAYGLGRRLPRVDSRIPKPDVVYGSSVHLLAVFSAYLLARSFDAHFVMEVRDLWPQTLVDMGVLSERSLVTKFLRSSEKFLYSKAERIIVLPPKAVDYIADLGVDASKVHWIPNGVDLSRFRFKEVGGAKGEGFTVMYVGAHGLANDLGVLLRAARTIQNRGFSAIRFVLVGGGPEKPRLIAYKELSGLTNTEFRDEIPKTLVPNTLQQADALVLVLQDLALYKYGISLNKLFDYLAAGKPVILAGHPANDVVGEAGCGLSVPPANPDALADAIIRIYEAGPEERQVMGARGRGYVQQHHDYSVLANRLVGILQGLENGAL